MNYLDELKDSLAKGKAVVGTRRTVKYLKANRLKLVIMASNCTEEIRKEIENYSKSSNMKVEKFDGTGKQLGLFCGKPFPIAVVSIVK